MTSEVEKCRAELAHSLSELGYLEEVLAKTAAASERATPGGLTGYDPALLSGIRRKPNRRQDAARFAAYDREATANLAVERLRQLVAVKERALARALHNEATTFTPEQLAAATHIRADDGWHHVIRVNAKSVTVPTPYSWTDRIPIDRIREVRTVPSP